MIAIVIILIIVSIALGGIISSMLTTKLNSIEKIYGWFGIVAGFILMYVLMTLLYDIFQQAQNLP